MNIFEGRNWDQQVEVGYAEFYQVASEHSENDFSLDEDKPDLSQEAYMDIAKSFAHEFPRSLFRGMKIRQHDLENATHLGIYYSDHKGHSQSFARGSDTYDERFADMNLSEEGRIGIIIEVEPVPLNSIDAPITLAMNIYGGEGEVRLLENEPVRIKMITDAMGRGIWQHLWGADYLT